MYCSKDRRDTVKVPGDERKGCACARLVLSPRSEFSNRPFFSRYGREISILYKMQEKMYRKVTGGNFESRRRWFWNWPQQCIIYKLLENYQEATAEKRSTYIRRDIYDHSISARKNCDFRTRSHTEYSGQCRITNSHPAKKTAMNPILRISVQKLFSERGASI